MRLSCAIAVLMILTICRGAVLPSGPQEIPFEFRDGLIWIEVTLSASRAPLHCLLDSGAQVSAINLATAQRLGLRGQSQVIVQGLGGRVTGHFSEPVDARAGDVPLPRNLLLLDLQKLSHSCTNGEVDGIVGADFFRDRIVQIDFQRHRVRLLRERPNDPGTEVVPLKVSRSGMLVPVEVNGTVSQRVRLDTGCAPALVCVSRDVKTQRCTQRVAMGLAGVAVAVTNATVTLAGHRFERVPTDLHAEAIFPGEKGLLGNGLLARYGVITIDAKDGKLFLH